MGFLEGDFRESDNTVWNATGYEIEILKVLQQKFHFEFVSINPLSNMTVFY